MDERICIWVLSGAVAGVLAVGTPESAAGPVTFAFQAEITTVYDTIPFDAGLDVAVGDRIIGTFTFVPQILETSPPQGSTQPVSQTLDVDQFTGFEISVDGESFVIPNSFGSYTLRSVNDAFVVDHPLTFSHDILFAGGALGPLDPIGLPGVSNDAS